MVQASNQLFTVYLGAPASRGGLYTDDIIRPPGPRPQNFDAGKCGHRATVLIRTVIIIMAKTWKVSAYVKCIATVFAVVVVGTSLTFPAQTGIAEWKMVERVSPDEPVVVTFAIKQTNRAWLARKLREVSYPDSPEYGNYMNFGEIARYVHGRPESVQAVLRALESVGVPSNQVDFTIGMGFAVASLPAGSAEKLFSSKLYRFHHKTKNMFVMRSMEFTIPASISEHVDFVSGLTGFPRNMVSPKQCEKRSSTVGTNPDSLDKLYNISEYTSTSKDNSQAIASFLEQYFAPSDLKEFQKGFNMTDNPIAKVVGFNNPDDPGTEASLDVQYITAIGRNVNTWFVSVSTYSNGHQEDFLSWIVNQVNTTDSPWVHSVSYGDLESSIDPSFLQRVNDEFAKFGISGRTVLFASGDSGADCQILTGKVRPMWPASSPYVTAVGGTVSLSEVWEMGGGGFSNAFPTPDYQKSAVDAYLNTGGVPDRKHFNPNGRAYPDLSLLSVDYDIVIDDIPLGVDGTSCSTPTTAGIISLLNDIRLKAGKKTLGFLNPLLYQKLQGQGFFDIIKGTNRGEDLFCRGFSATKGWDAASGWGSPNFGILKDLVNY